MGRASGTEPAVDGGDDGNTTTTNNPAVILEGVGWKRRSGWAKYSESVGYGSAWERRRFTLTSRPARLSYYAAPDDDGDDGVTRRGGDNGAAVTSTATSTNTNSNDRDAAGAESTRPRGVLDILPERATVTATYPADSSQPTPYAVSIKTGGESSGGSDKWKFCFDDRETQLIWLVALTDIVAEASVAEYNARVLSAEASKSHSAGDGSGGFHRLYEESDDVRLLDLVHRALMSSGTSARRAASMGRLKRGASSSSEGGGGMDVEVVRRSAAGGGPPHESIRIVTSRSNDTMTSGSIGGGSPMASSVPSQQQAGGGASGAARCFDGVAGGDGGGGAEDIPAEKLYRALAVVAASLLLERAADLRSSSLFWQLVNAVVLCVCFYPASAKGKASGEKERQEGKEGLLGDEGGTRDSDRGSEGMDDDGRLSILLRRLLFFEGRGPERAKSTYFITNS